MGMMWKFDAGPELKRHISFLDGSLELCALTCGIEPERFRRILDYEECATENEIENIAEQSGFDKCLLVGLMERKITEYWGDTFGHPITPEPSRPETPYACVVQVNNSPYSTILNQSPNGTITQTNNFNNSADMTDEQLLQALAAISKSISELPGKDDMNRLVEEITAAVQAKDKKTVLQKFNELSGMTSNIISVGSFLAKVIGI